MARLAGERVSILKADQRDLTLAFLGAPGQADAEFPCHTPPISIFDQSFAAREQDRG
jgi:hypothetical protein